MRELPLKEERGGGQLMTVISVKESMENVK